MLVIDIWIITSANPPEADAWTLLDYLGAPGSRGINQRRKAQDFFPGSAGFPVSFHIQISVRFAQGYWSASYFPRAGRDRPGVWLID